ncbi:dipicolinate synthase subunit B [Qingrenia yutianensis]|uniref:Dipicolinate synthase subunit B n=1 Tax=Qingrenia yutianensis TaxID=2763676 RepID=A0A926F8V4_9FIRM|nr:dipicolinate synthase subunit B [Qingrenia yutianensis]MBC8596075.1 dipicolinate synthase subunit B [Qingrenia yutianensis]
MKFENLTVGFAVTGSFCTLKKTVAHIRDLTENGADVIPIMSEITYNTDTRFGKAEDFISEIKSITGNEIITSIKGAEPIGPKNILDALIIAPCTGNTLSKIALGMTDSCVAMAAKANLRNENPLVIAVSTNDGLGASAQNIAHLMNAKNVYFVPFGQDDAVKKPNSLVADMSKIADTLDFALSGRQIQPILKV